MVLDATSTAFPRPSALGNPSAPAAILPVAKPSVPQSLPDAPARPTKRRRTLASHLATPLTTPSPGPSSVSSGIDFDVLDAARRRSSARVMSLWESLAARYARPLDEDDEIDILTGKIYKDRGVLRAASDRGWRIGSFGEAIEVEPIGGVSEAETETGTSECDDEGEGADTAGDTEDADEGDAFEAWSYDWQYRQLPPPRPELSPQDAEDLKEFLAAECAIQEETGWKNGEKPRQEDGEDEVVYLGDSLHDQNGALLDDDSDDEEFSSFAVDDPTVQLSKREEEEDDDVEPMSSILGALAIGKTPQKSSPASIRMDNSRDTRAAEQTGLHDRYKRVQNTSAPSISKPSSGPGSEVGIEDDLIVIESDTDEEIDVDTNKSPKLRSAHATSLSSLAVSPSKATSSKALTGKPPSVSRSSSIEHVPDVLSIPVDSAPLSGASQQKRTSFSAMIAALQASAIADAPKPQDSNSVPTESFYSKSSTSKPATKPISKRMRPRETTNAKDGGAVSKISASGSQPSPKRVVKRPTSTVAKVSTNSIPVAPQKAVSKTPSKQADESQRVSNTTPRLTPRKSTDCTSSKPVGGSGVVDKNNALQLPGLVPTKTSDLTLPIPPPATSPSRPVRLDSPAKCRKKPLVMEVVLTHSPRAPKPIPQPANSYAPVTLVKPLPADTHVLGSGLPSGSTPTSNTKFAVRTTDTNKEKLSRSSDNNGRPSTELQVNRTRKRGRESGEGFKAEEPGKQAEVTPVEQLQAVDRAHSCCSSTPLGSGQDQLTTHCSMPFGCFPPPQPAHQCQHSHPHGTHTHPHMHHCSGVHQHQHQHLHTHLPFPLPQHMNQFTANELTEAALKLMYGLGAIRPSDSNAYGNGMWLPPGTHTAHGIATKSQVHAGPSFEVSPPKLEQESSSQELVPDSQERVPSSQEYERRKEEELRKGKVKAQPSPTKPVCKDAVLPPNSEPLSRLVIQSRATPLNRPTTPPSPLMDVSSTPPRNSPSSKIPTPKRESSVIDIESDSDDELAGFNAGEGSIRWVPPIKDETDSDGDLYLNDSDDDIMLLDSPEGKSKRRLRPRRGREKRQQTSPSKLH